MDYSKYTPKVPGVWFVKTNASVEDEECEWLIFKSVDEYQWVETLGKLHSAMKGGLVPLYETDWERVVADFEDDAARNEYIDDRAHLQVPYHFLKGENFEV